MTTYVDGILGVIFPDGTIQSTAAGTGNITPQNVSTPGNVTASGNITGTYIIGDGSLLTGLPASYSNANVADYLPIYSGNLAAGNIYTSGNITGNRFYGNIMTAVQPNITSVGTLSSLSVAGAVTANTLQINANAVIQGDMTINGNVSLPGNINQISGNSGQFFGDTNGFGALYAGISSGYSVQDDTIIQISGDINNYAQVNLQNINSGADASGDFVVTADIGTNDIYYVDMGIASSTFDGTSPNALGTSVEPNDSYLYAVGNTSTDQGGNLVIGTKTSGRDIIFVVGGGNTSDTVARLSSGTVNVIGNVTANHFIGNGSTLSSITGSNVTGTVPSATVSATVTTNAQPNITSVGTLTSLSITGNVSANYFIGNGSLLSNINAGNITGAYSNANVADYLPTYSGNVGGANAVITGTVYANTVSAPNGTLTILSNLDVKGNVTYIESNVVTINDVAITLANNASNAAQANGGGFTINGANASFTFDSLSNAFVSSQPLSTSGNVTANYHIGNGSTLSSITGSNVTGTVPSATVAATVTTNAQPNITSVGTLTSLSITGNATANYFIGDGSLLTNLPLGGYSNANVAAYLPTYSGNVSANYFIGDGSLLTNLPLGGYSNANVAAYLPTYSGNVSANYFIGNGSTLSSITGSNVTGTVANATTAGTVTTNAQANITSVGTLSSLSVSGSLTVSSGITNGAANGTSNIGSSSGYFNTIFAQATSAQYADIAENYLADAVYDPGTVVSFGGSQEVTLTTSDSDKKIAGIITTAPAYHMNSGLIGEYIAPIALLGRVPCLVKGPVQAGDLMVSAGEGRARSEENPRIGTVIGKAVESFDGDFGIIEIVVGRL